VSARWRSALFVPGNRPELAAKAARLGADLVVLDLEDAVPPAGKAEARELLGQAARTLVGVVPVAVRVNPPGTTWFADDVAALPDGLAAVVVPKLESGTQRDEVATATAGRPLLAGIETVQGVVDAREVLRHPVVACYFGAEDYVVDLGGVRTDGNAEVAWARSWVAVCARLAGVSALDLVTLHYGDADRFRREALEARALGYAGKLCIHPAQVPLANAAFAPSSEEVAWAGRVLGAFEEGGGATVGVDGAMVDEVVAARARAILGHGGEGRT
jgi:citrate lyase subunit beta/citryl-CoA lyase